MSRSVLRSIPGAPGAHPDDAELVRYLDDELPAPDRARTSAHLAACDACAARADDLRRTSALLGGVAREIALPASLGAPWGESARSRPLALHPPPAMPGRARGRPAAIAAGLLAACAVAAAAATPAVQQRLAGLAHALRPERAPAAAAAVVPESAAGAIAAPSAAAGGESAVAFVPGQPELVVAFSVGHPGDSLRLRAVSSAEVTVRIPAGVAAGVWSMPAGPRIANERSAAATYAVDVSPGVGTVRVRVGDRVVLTLGRAALAARGEVTLPLR